MTQQFHCNMCTTEDVKESLELPFLIAKIVICILYGILYSSQDKRSDM